MALKNTLQALNAEAEKIEESRNHYIYDDMASGDHAKGQPVNYETLLKDNEDLSKQVRALESSQEQLNSELRKKGGIVQALENTLRAQDAEAERKIQETHSQYKELEQSWKNQVLLVREQLANCETNIINLNLLVKSLTTALDFKESKCASLRQELEQKKWMGSSREDLKVMLTKLEEAAEKKSALQAEYEEKLGQLSLEVAALKHALLTRYTEITHLKIQAAEKGRESNDNQLVDNLVKLMCDQKLEATVTKAKMQAEDEELKSKISSSKETLENSFQTWDDEKRKLIADITNLQKQAQKEKEERQQEREDLLKWSQENETSWITREAQWMEDKNSTNRDIQVLLARNMKLDRLASMTDKEKAQLKKAEDKVRKESAKLQEKEWRERKERQEWREKQQRENDGLEKSRREMQERKDRNRKEMEKREVGEGGGEGEIEQRREMKERMERARGEAGESARTSEGGKREKRGR